NVAGHYRRLAGNPDTRELSAERRPTRYYGARLASRQDRRRHDRHDPAPSADQGRSAPTTRVVWSGTDGVLRGRPAWREAEPSLLQKASAARWDAKWSPCRDEALASVNSGARGHDSHGWVRPAQPVASVATSGRGGYVNARPRVLEKQGWMPSPGVSTLGCLTLGGTGTLGSGG